VGGLADSFYEYLLKIWVYTDHHFEKFRFLYDESVAAIRRVLVKTTSNGDVYVGRGNTGYVENSMEHLVRASLTRPRA
jgi:mannosyl-oligosaccharide alpha-1,2-mannosidase